MTLSAIQKLDLQDELDDLMVKAASAKGLDLLDINDQIDEVMTKLGYGTAPLPEPVPQQEVTPPPAGNQLVTDYVADKFIDQPLAEFVDTLHSLEQFVGSDITFDQVKEHAANWLANSGIAA